MTDDNNSYNPLKSIQNKQAILNIIYLTNLLVRVVVSKCSN